MTDHLDDEILSAAIDGEAPAGALDHVASCPTCAGRLGALRMVASALSASTVPTPADEAGRAVTAALDAALSAPAGAGGEGPQTGVLVALRRRPAGLAVAAAAAAALILAAGITGALRHGRSSTLPAAEKSVSAPSRFPGGNGAENVPGALGAAPAAPAFGAPVVTGPDLGAQSDAATVAGLVRARLNSAAPAPQSGAVAPSSTDQTLACAPEAAGAAGASPTSPLRLIAPLQWRGQPAVVFVFGQPGSASGLAGVIVRRSDCGALATLPL
jgi:hypothetical protein